MEHLSSFRKSSLRDSNLPFSVVISIILVDDSFGYRSLVFRVFCCCFLSHSWDFLLPLWFWSLGWDLYNMLGLWKLKKKRLRIWFFVPTTWISETHKKTMFCAVLSFFHYSMNSWRLDLLEGMSFKLGFAMTVFSYGLWFKDWWLCLTKHFYIFFSTWIYDLFI